MQAILDNTAVPSSMKLKISDLNDLAKDASGTPILSGYFKATSGSRYTSKAPMSTKLFPIFGFNVTKAGNFTVPTFQIGNFEAKIGRWLKSPRKSKFFETWDNDISAFREDVLSYLGNQSKNLPGDTTIGVKKRDAINDFLNITTEEFRGAIPRLSGKSKAENMIVSLRVDRIASVDAGVGAAFPISYERIKRNFLPFEDDLAQ